MLVLMSASRAADNNPEHDSTTGDHVSFDPVFLNVGNEQNIDLTRFENGATALPGTYPTDIYVNGEQISRENVIFAEQENKKVVPCLTPEILRKINFNYSQLPQSFTDTLRSGQTCSPLPVLIPQAQMSYDSGAQRLDISIPQAMMANTARGTVSPELWDAGIPALLLGYTTNFYVNKSQGVETRSAYAGLNAGLNLGAWYFRHDGNYNWQENAGSQYQSINNYVQRDIPAIKGRFRLGETSTQGQLFDTLPFRGAELVNDDRMLPQSQRGYAPDIRGIARTNAKVTIRQNNRVIYETTVSPGAFVIDDLYPTGYGGNLDVTVTEADGSQQTFQVPYASVTQLLRPGAHRYDVVVGKLNDLSLDSNPALYQATYQRGITNSITGYGGVQGSDDYYAVQLGTALGTKVGAFAADITQAKTHLQYTGKKKTEGQSYQLSYSKYLPESDSNLTIAAYRYSTEGYYDYLTAMRAINAEKHGRSADNIWQPRNRFNITLNQGLTDGWGQVYVTGYTQDYWNRSNSDLQYQLGYSNSFRSVSFSMSAGRVRNDRGSMETNWLFNISMPLGNLVNSNVPTLNASLNHSTDGRTGEQLGISGTAGSDNEYSYGVSAMNYNQGSGSSMAMNGGYRSPYTAMTATYGTGKHYQNASVGLSGTAIAWQNGVVFTPYTGDTFAIVEAEGAKGAKVGGYSGIRIDPWGHAAIPYLSPYEMNEVTINPKGLPQNVSLDNTSSKVAPYAGAVSRVVFKTQRGTPLLINARRADGEELPFGAEVYNAEGSNVGYAGQMGQIFARVNQAKGMLTVKWGGAAAQQCQITYYFPMNKDGKIQDSLVRMNSICR